MKIVIIAGFDASLLNFRGSLLETLVKNGHEVIGVAPAETPDVPTQLATIGVRFVAVELNRAGLNPLHDWQSYRALEAFFRQEKPDLALAYTIKPVIYGIVAAKKAGVPHIYALITGLGAAFNTRGIKGWGLRLLASHLYRRSLRNCSCTLVQNQDIAKLFLRERIIERPLS